MRCMGRHLRWKLGAALLLGLPACSDTTTPAESLSGAPVREWMELACHRARAENLTAPAASRTFAYTGLAAFEAMRVGDERPSFLRRLNELHFLPVWKDYRADPAAAVAAATARVAFQMWTSDESQAAIESLRDRQIAAREAAGVDVRVIRESIAYGEDIGDAIAVWADADGVAMVSDLRWAGPQRDAYWTPTPPEFAPALLPYWGTNRSYAVADGAACSAPPPPGYSDQADSEFYQQAREVYERSQTLSHEESAIALFWADPPGTTATLPGHWMEIASSELQRDDASLAHSAEVYAYLGIAMADGIITAWRSKYDTLVVRPISWIQRNVDPNWKALVRTPPFPGYTSGHAAVSGAAALVLEELMGDRHVVDGTHMPRGMAVRSFTSFRAMAKEAAVSRLYGGIHFRAGIENGLSQGACVADTLLGTR